MIQLIVMAFWAGGWTAPVEVLHELKPVVSYRAQLSGEQLAVEVKLDTGWHTFSIDNQQRVDEKLAGKKALSYDRPTEIKLSEGLVAEGGWLQTPPKDFSKPELRWFAWGFEDRALFVTKVRRTGKGDGKVAIRGQACTETVCKNVDVAIVVPAGGGDGEAIEVKGLVAAGR